MSIEKSFSLSNNKYGFNHVAYTVYIYKVTI